MFGGNSLSKYLCPWTWTVRRSTAGDREYSMTNCTALVPTDRTDLLVVRLSFRSVFRQLLSFYGWTWAEKVFVGIKINKQQQQKNVCDVSLHNQGNGDVEWQTTCLSFWFNTSALYETVLTLSFLMSFQVCENIVLCSRGTNCILYWFSKGQGILFLQAQSFIIFIHLLYRTGGNPTSTQRPPCADFLRQPGTSHTAVDGFTLKSWCVFFSR